MEKENKVTLTMKVTFEAVAEQPEMVRLPESQIVSCLQKLAKQRVENKQQELLRNQARIFRIEYDDTYAYIYYTREDGLQRCYSLKTIHSLNAFAKDTLSGQQLYDYLMQWDRGLLYQLIKCLAMPEAYTEVPYHTAVLATVLDAYNAKRN